MFTMDVHFHVVPARFIAAIRRGELAEAVTIASRNGIEHFDFHAPPDVPVEPDTALQPEMYDEACILAALDARGLDAAAISPAPETFVAWASSGVGERIAATMNDGLAELARHHPHRLYGLATLPMQDGEAAARELRRAVSELGLRGAAVCTQIDGADLDADRFAPLFRAAEQLGVPLFLHPQNHGDLRRLQDYHLWNLVGFPFETALAAARLMLGGVFERHPGLQVILAHGGGFFPYQVGRLDHGWRTRPALRRALPHSPSHYLANVFCDSLVHDAGALRFLIERVGWDHVVLGCDYPFGMGSATPVEAVQGLRLPGAQDAAILGGTLAGLLRVVPQAEPEAP